MKIVVIMLLALLVMAVGCEKQNVTGDILFCTNSYIVNCAFSIEISVDGRVRDTLTAASTYSSSNCACPETSFIGTIVDVEIGSHTYYAKELDCAAINRINEWSGSVSIRNDSCETVVLNITK